MSGARRLVLLPIVLATLGSVAPAAWAAWPSDPNVNVPLCTATNFQFNPMIASDGAGGAIVTWVDRTSYDIYVQRVNAAGVPQWTANGVALCTAANEQSTPTIASDGAGGAIVTWQDNRSGTNNDIYAQRVNAAGVPQWTADGVALCTAANFQYNPTIASDGAGGAIVTWQDQRVPDYHIYAQRVNAAGVPQWTADGVALCTAAIGQRGPTIVSDLEGGAVVTWRDYRSTTGADIYAQRVNPAGVPQWTANGVALCTAASNQYNPTIASDGTGGAIVTWEDFRSGTYYDIYAQRVNAAGVPQWLANGVALCTAANNQQLPTIASDGAGGAFVTWYDIRTGTNYDIYTQRVSAAGVPQWTADGLELCTSANEQSHPTIASDGTGGAIVTWQDYRDGITDIYAQRVNAAGVPQWTGNGVVLCSAASAQYNPTITSDGAGGAIVTWEDFRGGTYYDIYAQNVNPDGTLGGTVVSVPPLSIATSFALHSVQPNPSFGEFRVSFSLVDGTPAMLELYDLTGRRIESQSVGGFGPGTHVTSLTPRVASLPPGIYCVSLTQGSHRALSKVAIVR